MEIKSIVESNQTVGGYYEDDFFEQLYSDSILKQVTVATFFIGSIVGLISEVGIIWYERNGIHQYRTVINQMFATISWLVVAYILTVYIPEGIRYMVGPLNTTYCEIHNFLKNFFWSCTILTLDGIILLRYIFIFKWKRATVNDDLIARFLQLTILLASFWTAAVKRISIGRMPLNYFMCAGKNPNDGSKSAENGYGKLDTLSILVSSSFVLHAFVFSKIFHYQRKMEKKMTNIRLGCIDGEADKDTRKIAWSNETCNMIPIDKIAKLPKSMADLTTQILALIFHIVMATLAIIMNRLNPEDLNEYHYRWIAYTIQIIGLAAASVFVHAFYILRNVAFTDAIKRRILDIVRN